MSPASRPAKSNRQQSAGYSHGSTAPQQSDVGPATPEHNRTEDRRSRTNSRRHPLSEPLDHHAQMRLIHAEVVHAFVKVALGKLAVEPGYQSQSLLPMNLAIPDFMRRIRRGPPDAELEIPEVVVQTVQLVVEAGVFAVCSLASTLIIRFEIRMFAR